MSHSDCIRERVDQWDATTSQISRGPRPSDGECQYVFGVGVWMIDILALGGASVSERVMTLGEDIVLVTSAGAGDSPLW